MKPKNSQVIKFINAINLTKFATVGKITCFDDYVSCELIDLHDEYPEYPEDIHREMAEALNLKSVNSKDKFGNIFYMVNMPNYGSFGIKMEKSKHFDNNIFNFVIFDKKYFKQFKSLQY